MRSNDSNESNESLRKTLKEWKVTTPLPSRFQEQVWQRIAQPDAKSRVSPWAAAMKWLETLLPRPALAASYLMILLGSGLVTGYWQAQQKKAELADTLGVRYVQEVDPYQTPRQ
jgi:hypothetical protein